MRRIAYIPARGGSKGVPKKNIRLICGTPLIAYTINAAKQSCLFDKILVSTDNEEIADIAIAHGAWVPFLRDSSVAGDNSRSIDAICSDKEKLEANGFTFDSLCMLQPTSPLRTAVDINGAYKLFEEKNCGVVSLSPVQENPYLMRSIAMDKSVQHILPLRGALRRQDIPKYYKINGAIYINSWDDLTPTLTQADNPYGFVMSRESSIDIDTEEDILIAEKILMQRRQQKCN